MAIPPFRYASSRLDLATAPAHGDRLILWLARRQWRTLLGGMLLGIAWMVAVALQPAAIGAAIDDGLSTGDRAGLLRWTAAIAALGVIIGLLASARHVLAVRNWIHAAFRAALVAHDGALRAGPALTREVPSGEVVTTLTRDVWRMGHTFDVTARFSGALVSFVVVAVLLLRTSVTLGLVLLLGGPLLTSTIGLVVSVLGARQETQREAFGAMTALGADTVAGLRVLRGIGGEEEFLRRYRAASSSVRAAGVHLAAVQATLASAQVLLPGVFVIVVVWLGSTMALAGEITPGQLVASYGYTAFLTLPLRTAVEFVESLTSTRVAARRIARVLRIVADHPETASTGDSGDSGDRGDSGDGGDSGDSGDGGDSGEASEQAGVSPRPASLGDLVDPDSGVHIRAGSLTVLASEQPEDSAVVLARLGRTAPGRHGVTWGGVPIDTVSIETIRAGSLVAAAHPDLFSGPLRHELRTARRAGPDTEQLLTAVHVAAAQDVLEALPDGLDTHLEERGRSLSGGQRQRVVLARALVADRDILLLVEPTSAVDTHTEARIVRRLRPARRGRTTVVTSVSPLVLAAADEVIHLIDGRVHGRGTHAHLLATAPEYARLVTRGEEE